MKKTFEKTRLNTNISNTNGSNTNISSSSESNISDAIRAEYKYARAGLVVGVVCILSGLILFILGVTGATSWTAKILGAESTLADAAPGAVLFIVGLFMVYITGYNLTVGSK